MEFTLALEFTFSSQRQRNRGIVRRESWKQEGGFFKKGNMVDGNVVKDYT